MYKRQILDCETNQLYITSSGIRKALLNEDMISVMEGDKQVAGIPVKIVKSTMSKIQSKQDDVDIVILEDLSEITKML
mgnify:FL=1